MNERLKKVTTWLEEQNIDGAFFTSTENVFYLSGFYTDPHERLLGLLASKKGDAILILPKMEATQARDAGWEDEMLSYEDHEDPWGILGQKISELGLQGAEEVAIEKEVLTYERAEKLSEIFEKASFVDGSKKMNELRLIKEENEIEILRKAAQLADYGVEVGVQALKEGVTEMDVVATIEYELKRKGIREMSFSTLVLFGEKSGQPHGNPGNRPLKKGDFVLFDLGVVLDGYCSDITRTVVYQSVSNKQKEIYDTVLRANNASLKESRPGTRIGDLDIVARDTIERAGYGEYFTHRIGHGLGISVHEFPSMSKNNDGVLKEGMVYTIEPGIYLSDLGGVRIEDDVLITKDGYETLTKFPKELIVIS